MINHELALVGIFFISVLVALLSGIAGGGGGLVITPFFIWLGLTPQETIATGKLASFGVNAGAIVAFGDRLHKRKRLLAGVLLMTLVIAFISAYLFQHLDNTLLQRAMGVVMVLMVPFVLAEKSGLKGTKTSLRRKRLGYVVLALVLLLQGIMSGGIGTLISVVFIYFFGTTVLEGNNLMRVISIVLNTVIVVLLLHTNLIIYSYGFAGLVGSLIGGYYGSKIAIKRGNAFARVGLAVFMGIAGVALFFGA